MTPVEQTITQPPYGNCWPACIASLLDLPLQDVPQFFHGATEECHWWDQWQDWLARFGLELQCIEAEHIPNLAPAGYSIMTVESPRGPYLHATIAKDGELVWDPSPKRADGIGRVVDWALIRPLGAGTELEVVPKKQEDADA